MDDLGDENASTVSANTASIAVVAGNSKEVDLKNHEGSRGALARFGNHTSSKLIREHEGVIVAVVIIANGVEVDGDHIPRVIAIARQVELTSNHTADLRSRADIATTDVITDVTVKIRPVVESRDRTISLGDTLMAIKIVVGMKSPGVKAGGQDDTVERGRVVGDVEMDKDSIDKSVAGRGRTDSNLKIGGVRNPRREEIGRAIRKVGVDVTVFVASALSSDDLGESRRARERDGSSSRAASAIMKGLMRAKARSIGRGGVGGTRSIGRKRRSGRRGSVGDGMANLRTKPTSGDHGATRACRVEGERRSARLQNSIDKVSESPR